MNIVQGLEVFIAVGLICGGIETIAWALEQRRQRRKVWVPDIYKGMGQ